MRLRVVRSLATSAGVLNPGAVVEVPDQVGKAWVAAGLAVVAEGPGPSETGTAGPSEAEAAEPSEAEAAGPAKTATGGPEKRDGRRRR